MQKAITKLIISKIIQVIILPSKPEEIAQIDKIVHGIGMRSMYLNSKGGVITQTPLGRHR